MNSKGYSTVNLEKTIEEINYCQKYVNDVTKKCTCLEEEVEKLKKLLAASNEKEIRLQNEIKEANNWIDMLKKSLTEHCDLQDNKRQLTTEVENLKEQIENAKQMEKRKCAEHEQNIAFQEKKFAQEMKELETRLKSQAKLQEELLYKTLQEKESEIEKLCRQNVEQEKEKQSQMIQLKIECDSKLMKLQKQSSKLAQPTGSMVQNDIYRKKLQHIKTESEKEISSLKTKIAELQQQLLSTEDKYSGHHTSLSKKKRF